jgi:hypothetical protein
MIVMATMASNLLRHVVMLLVLCATGVVAGGEPALDLKPRDQHHGELGFPLDNRHVKLWLCDYEGRANADLIVAVDVIRGGKRERLAEAATSVDGESRGVIYLACSEDDQTVMPRAIGVTGDNGGLRKSSALAAVPLGPKQKFDRTAFISKACEVHGDKEAFAYLFLYRDQDARKPLTLPDLRDDSPFDSMRPEDIRKVAEALPDAVTILVTVRAEVRKP